MPKPSFNYEGKRPSSFEKVAASPFSPNKAISTIFLALHD